MKRERRAAARLAGWGAVRKRVLDLAERAAPDFLALGSDEEARLASTTYRELLARMETWLELNKPRGT